MTELRVKLFGSASVTLRGQPVKLQPLALAVLIRLLVAEGAPVTVEELYRDCWPSVKRLVGDYKTPVQKRILQIRRAVDPAWSDASGKDSALLPTDRGRLTAYRLNVDRAAVDVFQFADLVAQASRGAPGDAVPLLKGALALWGGSPLLDVADTPWAAEPIRQLSGLRGTAERELARSTELAGSVRRKDLVGSRTAVVVMTSDLFTQDDANLVVGFSDTFDTDTDRNIVISAESVQGRLLHTLYDGDRAQLDKDLKSALARVPKVAVESRSAKPRGKLTRYPVGTVATLHHATRRVFALAYSRMGNDLMAQSGLPELRLSLDKLWDAVYRHGQLKPVAMPLVGAGLSRIGANHEDLLAMIVSSFAASARERYLAPELRILLPQQVFDAIDVTAVLQSATEQGRSTLEDEGIRNER